ncbi:Hypothetical protein A7982_07914 [Minicystis rosea]|nr:Hypothetical protein A7982_07914 [Minicystis rosea]
MSKAIRGVAADGAGNVLLVGTFFDSIDLGGGLLTSAGGQDIFVAKLDASGKHLRSKRFGDAGEPTGVSIAADSADNAIVAGFFGGSLDFGGGLLVSSGSPASIFVAKLAADGSHIWSEAFDSGGAADIVVDHGRNLLITGNFSGAVDFGGGPLASAGGQDIFLTKLDAKRRSCVE